MPLGICGISLLRLWIRILSSDALWERGDGYRPISYEGERPGITGHRDAGPDEDDADEDVTVAGGSSGPSGDGGPSWRPTISRTNDAVFEVSKPRWELVLVVLEEIAVGAELAIHLAALLNQVWGPRGRMAALAGLLTWGYIFVLASIRLGLSTSSRYSYPALWNHTAALYGIQWLFTVVQFRSAVIHPRSGLAQGLIVADFALVTLLILIALTSRKGNVPILLEHEPGLEPSREPLASLFSRATFGWVDPVVWRGYRKTLELSDIWDLASKDKAAAIIHDFRQVKYVMRPSIHARLPPTPLTSSGKRPSWLGIS